MKKHPSFCLIIIAAIIAIPFAAHAAFNQPFGGKIITTNTPGVLCAAQYGAMVIAPVMIAPPGPYFIRTTTQMVRPGSWILGMYSSVPSIGTCNTTSTPPVPVPAFNIRTFGVSK
ncbi:MAG TPA: hypothetical protein VGE18_03265 [Candidatus Paceibacterota bacterium]